MININKEIIYKKRIILLTFFILGIIVYLPAIFSKFQFDSIFEIPQNPRIFEIKRAFIDIFTKKSNRTFTYFTFSINYFFSGKSPGFYKITNVIIHILSSFFLTLFIIKIPYLSKKGKENRKKIALLSGVVFLVAPIQTQAVTYTVQRLASLAGLMFFLSFYLYSLYKQNIKHKWYFYFLGMLTVFLGGRTKETFIVFPIAIMIYDFLYYKKIKIEGIIYSFLGFLPIILRIKDFFIEVVVKNNTINETLQSSFTLVDKSLNIGRFTYFITQFKVILRYLMLMILPLGQRIDYSYKVERSFMSIYVIVPMFIILFIIFLGFYFYKKDRIITFSIIILFLGFSVTSTIIPIQDLIFEHRAYISVAGFSMLLSYLVFLKKFKWRKYLILFLILFYSILTIIRNINWISMTSIWEDNYKKEKKLERVVLNLVNSCVYENKIEKAEKYLNIAINDYPTKELLFYNKLEILKRKNKLVEAVETGEVILRSNPTFYSISLILGEIYYDNLNNKPKTVYHLNRIKQKFDYHIDNDRLYILTCKILIESNQVDKALLLSNKILVLKDYKYLLKALIYELKGEYKEAEENYKKKFKHRTWKNKL